VLPEYRDPEAGRLDLLSAAMAVAAVLAVIFGLKQLAQDGLSPLAIAAVAGGLVVGVLWARRQRALADPMIDLGLFRHPGFSPALAVNFLAIFVVVGYFLFVAQYLQLVAGLTPFEAGLLSLPSAIGFIVGSQAAPRIVDRVKPGLLISGGLALGAVGLVLLAFVPATGGLPLLILASVVISLGLAPVFGLTTELIVGSAPPERAGAASGISETGAELGGALGLAGLGSIGVAIYRGGLASSLPPDVPPAAAAAARDTLGGAVSVAASLPADIGTALLTAARVAFVDGMHAAAAIAAVVGVGLAAFAYVTLRDRTTAAEEEVPTEPVKPEPVPPQPVKRPVHLRPPTPARECF
jgi:MFS transporter, DHA2 family, multidrug resistance protein